MHPSKGGVSALAITIVFTSIALLIIVMRIFTRAAIIKIVGIEDYIIIVAMAASIVYMALVILQVQTGMGEEVSFEDLEKLLELVWGTSQAYFLSLGLSKVSIVVQCLRIFRTSKTRLALYIFLGLSITYTSWALLSTIFNCVPPQGAWAVENPSKAKCLNTESVGFANAAINIVSDICLLVIPIPQLNALQIPRKQKIILITVFSCGGVACITSIIRLYSFWIISTSPELEKSVRSVEIAIWSGIEINLGIICASVPTLRPLAVRVIPKFLNSSLYHTSGRVYDNYQHSTRTKVTGNFSRHTHPDIPHKEPTGTNIMVQRSIELSTIPAHCADDSDQSSQDGSQNELFDGNGWNPVTLESGIAGNRWSRKV